MADLFDAGVYTFNAWADTETYKQKKARSSCKAVWDCYYDSPSQFYERWYGKFNPYMSEEETDRILYDENMSQAGNKLFRRGWEHAKNEWLKKHAQV